MKLATISLIVLFITGANASAQTRSDLDSTNPRQLAARCAYAQSDSSCAGLSRSDQEASSSQTAQAQFPSGGPRFGRRMPRPYGPRAFSYGSYDNGGHAALGGLIGFGAGFALGAAPNNNSNNRVGKGLIAGALGAVFGAAIGHGIATFPHAAFRRHRGWSGEEEESATATSSPSVAPAPAEAPRDARPSPASGN